MHVKCFEQCPATDNVASYKLPQKLNVLRI